MPRVPNVIRVLWCLLAMLGVAFELGASTLVGRRTVTADSFRNTAVMMKKMRRLMTKSSIGARSMPCSPLSSSWWRAFIRYPVVLNVML